MTTECKLTNKELIEKCEKLIDKLCKSGGKGWRMSVPVDLNNDSDILLTSLVNRFRKIIYNKRGVEPIEFNSKEEAIIFLQRAGILDEEGNLAEHYTSNLCYKTGLPCEHNCNGICKESC